MTEKLKLEDVKIMILMAGGTILWRQVYLKIVFCYVVKTNP